MENVWLFLHVLKSMVSGYDWVVILGGIIAMGNYQRLVMAC